MLPCATPNLLGQFADGQLRHAPLSEASESGVMDMGLCRTHRREKRTARLSVDKLKTDTQYISKQFN